eukprot:g1717.t1 g1717   contig10:2659108-2660425(+)
MVRMVQSSSLTFTSDIPKSTSLNSNTLHPTGILHATKRSSPTIANGCEEEHVFAWVANVEIVNRLVLHLEQRGFVAGVEHDNVEFIPYSSKENWMGRYPFAKPTVECDGSGNIASSVVLSQQPSKAKTSKHNAKKAPKRLFQSAILSNPERHELHMAIYDYFQFLHDKMAELGEPSSKEGRCVVASARVTTAGVQEVLEVIEKNFQVVQRMREQQSAFGKDVATGCDKGNTAAAMEKGAPLLEEALREPLSHLVEVAEKDPKNHILQTRKKEYDFDLMINKLLLYKNTIGNGNNCNVPCSYNDKQLARWVDNLRSKRRKLIESHNIDNTKPLFDKHLTEERVAALDGIGFVWNDTRERVPWEQRFQELCRWKESTDMQMCLVIVVASWENGYTFNVDSGVRRMQTFY